jgi:hypothetical protein
MIKTAILAVKVSFVRAAVVLAKGRMFDTPANRMEESECYKIITLQVEEGTLCCQVMEFQDTVERWARSFRIENDRHRKQTGYLLDTDHVDSQEVN